MVQDYTSGATAVTFGDARPLNGHIVKVGSQDERSPYEIITYWECSGGHIVIHTGHTDATTMTSVEDGSVETTIGCGSGDSQSSGAGWSIAIGGSDSLASVPQGLTAQMQLDGAVFVIATPTGTSQESEPVSTIWSTAACDGGHVVMHYGHEDPNTATSVYDGSVATTVPC